MKGYDDRTSDHVRGAVAAFESVMEGVAPHVVLLLSDEASYLKPRFDEERKERPVRRFLLRRIYTGRHKAIEGLKRVLVGHEVSDSGVGPLKVVAGCTILEVQVSERPPADIPDGSFEGVFEIRQLTVPKPR